MTAPAITSPLRRNLNGDVFTAPELVDGLRAAIAASTLSAEVARTAEREREQSELQASAGAARADA